MILITSAAPVSPEFTSEIGPLPPALLPVGNRRLYEHQVELLGQLGEPVFLSLPEEFDLPDRDRAWLDAREVEIIWVPSGISLGESVVFCLNAVGRWNGPLRIMHGDTLLHLEDFAEADIIAIDPNNGFYNRAIWTGDKSQILKNGRAHEGELVASGYFAFSDPTLLVRSILRRRGDFIQGMNDYASEKSISPRRSRMWLDFGHINTFFRSRTMLTTERAFNRLGATRRTIRKTSGDHSKMAAEFAWFENLPRPLRLYAPQCLGRDPGNGYSTEYLYLLPLSDLFVFGSLPIGVWMNVLSSCREFLDAAAEVAGPPKAASASALYLDKTVSRLEAYARHGLPVDHVITYDGVSCPSLLAIAEHAMRYIAPMGRRSVVHGDFCFSNILFDQRSTLIKLIDPRGLDADGEITIFGDPRYDHAKLYHSVIGLYDLIIAGRFELERKGPTELSALVFPDLPRLKEIQEAYLAHLVGKAPYSRTELQAITILLFLSMLPMHADRPDRQDAMVANALRLYLDLQATQQVSRGAARRLAS